MGFQTAIPDTTAYMIGGYLFIFGVIGLYVASLIIRRRNLERELDLLQQFENQAPDEGVGAPASS
jgi:CcmD family protein